MLVRDLGLLPYREAWAIQEQVHAQVVAGGEEQLLLVEHPPVITLGRRGMVDGHLLATPAELERQGVELVQSDRGGDITYHGPGQLVAYPIIRLADHGLSVSGYVHRLESAVVRTLARYGIQATTDPKAVGIWVSEAKICAVGVRIRRGVTLHGLALNVTPNLGHFALIVPCGLTGRSVTSLEKLLEAGAPQIGTIKAQLAADISVAIKVAG